MTVPLACDLAVFTPEQRRRHDDLAAALFGNPSAARALPGGYAFPIAAADLLAAAEFITLERLCCPFLTFDLRVEPDGGPVWLEMGGSGDIRTLLAYEFGIA